MSEQQKTKKAGILIALLVVPVFIIGFLKLFGVNEPVELDVITPEVSDCTIDTTTGDYQVPNFSGSDHDGKPFSNAQLQDKVSIINFIVATDTYEQLHYSMRRVQERYKSLPEVQYISHSIDPEIDSTALLKSLAEKYDALPNKWLFVKGETAPSMQLAKCGYGVELVQHEGKTKAYQFALVDKQGRIRGIYNGADRKDIDRLMHEVAVLLLQYEKQKS